VNLFKLKIFNYRSIRYRLIYFFEVFGFFLQQNRFVPRTIETNVKTRRYGVWMGGRLYFHASLPNQTRTSLYTMSYSSLRVTHSL